MPRIAKGDLITGLGLTAFGAYIVWQSSHWVIFGPDGPGPGFFPIFYGALMFLVAGYLALRSLRTASANHQAEDEEDHKGVWGALGAWVCLALSIPLMTVLGFVAGFSIFAFVLIRFIFGQPYLRAAVAAVAIAVALHIIFPVLLAVELPEGMLWGF